VGFPSPRTREGRSKGHSPLPSLWGGAGGWRDFPGMSTHAERVRGLAEHDGTFRRLIQTVREQRVVSTGRPGRPPKNRIATTGHFARYLHEQMKALTEARTDAAGRVVGVSDLYNEAAAQMITDLHALLGDDVRLPAGAVSLTAVLGLRELVNRPLHTPLRDL